MKSTVIEPLKHEGLFEVYQATVINGDSQGTIIIPHYKQEVPKTVQVQERRSKNHVSASVVAFTNHVCIVVEYEGNDDLEVVMLWPQKESQPEDTDSERTSDDVIAAFLHNKDNPPVITRVNLFPVGKCSALKVKGLSGNPPIILHHKLKSKKVLVSAFYSASRFPAPPFTCSRQCSDRVTVQFKSPPTGGGDIEFLVQANPERNSDETTDTQEKEDEKALPIKLVPVLFYQDSKQFTMLPGQLKPGCEVDLIHNFGRNVITRVLVDGEEITTNVTIHQTNENVSTVTFWNAIKDKTVNFVVTKI